MPSLHTAFATLCAGFLFPRVKTRWRPLPASYPLAMMFSLVYSGEHWIVDTLTGIGYAVVTMLATAWLESRWRHHRTHGRDHNPADTDDPRNRGFHDVATFGNEHPSTPRGGSG